MAKILDAKCKCGMNHDMTFCISDICPEYKKCMRHYDNHKFHSERISMSNFGNSKCEYFISKEDL